MINDFDWKEITLCETLQIFTFWPLGAKIIVKLISDWRQSWLKV